MKTFGIVALVAMIVIPSASFGWGPPRGRLAPRPFFPDVAVRGNFGRVPFGFLPNRVVVPSPLFFSPGWSGVYYGPSYWYPPYMYAPPYPLYSYPSYGYSPAPPAAAADSTYDRGYSEGYAHGYEEAQKEFSRKLELEKTPVDEQNKGGGPGQP